MSLNLRRPIAKTKLSDAVADELERMIREGELMVGDPLPSERDLMETFEVGRPSIREALAKLSRKGLVRIRSGERTLVTRPSPDDIIGELSVMSKDFLGQPGGIRYFDQLRMFFETSLVRFAAENASPDDIEALRAALELNRRSAGNPDLFKKTDINFHRVLARIPQNPIFEAVSTALADWVVTDRPPISETKESHERSIKDHAAIFEMIAAHDVDGADRAMTRHLKFVQDYYSTN